MHAPPVVSDELLRRFTRYRRHPCRARRQDRVLRRSVCTGLGYRTAFEPYAAQWALSDFARDIYAVDLAVAVVAIRRQRITSRS